MKRQIPIALLAALTVGCQHQAKPKEESLANLTQYGMPEAEEGRLILQERAHAVHTLSAHCDVVMTRHDGQSVDLDAQLVIEPPDKLRLRAWKFGQVAFDLTLRPDGLWIELPDDPDARKKILPATADTAQVAQKILLFNGGFFDTPNLEMTESGPQALEYTQTLESATLTCIVERTTVTPRVYMLEEPRNKPLFKLNLKEYQTFNGVEWPTRLRAQSKDGDLIDVTLSDVAINQELAAGAFVPPRRAEKQP